MESVSRLSKSIAQLKERNRAEDLPALSGLQELISSFLGARDLKDLFNPLFTIAGMTFSTEFLRT